MRGRHNIAFGPPNSGVGAKMMCATLKFGARQSDRTNMSKEAGPHGRPGWSST